MKKILILLDTYPSLSETFLYTLLENLTSQFNVIVYARKKGNAPNKLSEIIEVVYLPRNDYSHLIKITIWLFLFIKNYFKNRLKIKYFLKYLQNTYKNNYRAIFNNSYLVFPLLLIEKDITYFPFGGLATKFIDYIKFEKKCVLSLRGSDINIDPLLNQNYKNLLKESILSADAVHCVCDDIKKKAEKLIGMPDLKIKTIYTSISPSFFISNLRKEEKKKKIRIITVGRLNWRKGLEHGIMAIKYLKENGLDFEWMIVGDGNYKIPVQWAVKDMRLEDRVFLLGTKSHSDIKEALLEADIYFHPAVLEGISNAVLEAMAVGLPVVASYVGGMIEAIPTDEYGNLVPPRDWRAMTAALEDLINNPNKRIEIGETASKFVKSKFSSTQQIEGFSELFDLATKKDNR